MHPLLQEVQFACFEDGEGASSEASFLPSFSVSSPSQNGIRLEFPAPVVNTGVFAVESWEDDAVTINVATHAGTIHRFTYAVPAANDLSIFSQADLKAFPEPKPATRSRCDVLQTLGNDEILTVALWVNEYNLVLGTDAGRALGVNFGLPSDAKKMQEFVFSDESVIDAEDEEDVSEKDVCIVTVSADCVLRAWSFSAQSCLGRQQLRTLVTSQNDKSDEAGWEDEDLDGDDGSNSGVYATHAKMQKYEVEDSEWLFDLKEEGVMTLIDDFFAERILLPGRFSRQNLSNALLEAQNGALGFSAPSPFSHRLPKYKDVLVRFVSSRCVDAAGAAAVRTGTAPTVLRIRIWKELIALCTKHWRCENVPIGFGSTTNALLPGAPVMLRRNRVSLLFPSAPSITSAFVPQAEEGSTSGECVADVVSEVLPIFDAFPSQSFQSFIHREVADVASDWKVESFVALARHCVRLVLNPDFVGGSATVSAELVLTRSILRLSKLLGGDSSFQDQVFRDLVEHLFPFELWRGKASSPKREHDASDEEMDKEDCVMTDADYYSTTRRGFFSGHEMSFAFDQVASRTIDEMCNQSLRVVLLLAYLFVSQPNDSLVRFLQKRKQFRLLRAMFCCNLSDISLHGSKDGSSQQSEQVHQYVRSIEKALEQFIYDVVGLLKETVPRGHYDQLLSFLWTVVTQGLGHLAHHDGGDQSFAVQSFIWVNVFKYSVEERLFRDAHLALMHTAELSAALGSNSDAEDTASECVNYLVKELYRYGHLDLICELQWGSLESHVEKYIMWQAANATVVQGDGLDAGAVRYYNLLFTFYMRKQQPANAASSLYALALRLRLAVSTSKAALEAQRNALNAACNALRALPVENRWVVRKLHTEELKRSVVDTSKEKSPLSVVTLDDMSQEMAVLDGKLRLLALGHSESVLLSTMDGDEVVALLVDAVHSSCSNSSATLAERRRAGVRSIEIAADIAGRSSKTNLTKSLARYCVASEHPASSISRVDSDLLWELLEMLLMHSTSLEQYEVAAETVLDFWQQQGRLELVENLLLNSFQTKTSIWIPYNLIDALLDSTAAVLSQDVSAEVSVAAMKKLREQDHSLRQQFTRYFDSINALQQAKEAANLARGSMDLDL
eukprot:jgi/Phyca11/532528/estExt2_fgenesh1_pg.C_PHYCAscaffold_60032